jgi:Holliday junction resolvase RusA-like endonuclease
MARSLSDLSSDIDALYQLPFAEFTAGRNALAKRVGGEQGKEAAAGIKGLDKPSISAWVVNQLYWQHKRDFDRLLKAGDDLRAVQQKRLAGRDGDVAASLDTRREALGTLMSKAAELLKESGSTSDDIRQRVGMTLEALSVYGTSDAGPRAGRLVTDVQPPGFAALAALVPAGPAGRTHATKDDGEDAPPAKAKSPTTLKAVPPKPESKRLEKARQALQEAGTQLEQARAAAEKAAAGQAGAQEEWESARTALDALQKKLHDAMDRERTAQIARDEQRRAATQAAHAVQRAERTRDEADRYVQSMLRE